MKKVFLVVMAVMFLVGFTSCEPDSVTDTENIYAGDKDEEPDRES